MGDLIMTFPLLGWLRRQYPDRPLWTVAEPRFFEALRPLAPQTVFFPPEAEEQLRAVRFHSVVNVSHRKEAARLAGAADAEQRFGAFMRGDSMHINGYWSLHRASIVHNNRHNLFHWSDLQLLDHSRRPVLPHLRLSPESTAHKDKVGIIVGASEEGKRPTPEFLGKLAQALLRKGLRPIFFGGPGDAALGEAAARTAGVPGADMCGRFSVAELAEAMRELALCITPDTGPMHLAGWVGVPVLNISMGPVNPWETGPMAPGHHVLRPRLSCAGCWRCRHAVPRCAAALHPGRVALLAYALLRRPEALTSLELPGLELYRTARDAHGLYLLEPVSGGPVCPAGSSRMLLARFWREWFRQGAALPAQCASALEQLAEQRPVLAKKLGQATIRLGRDISRRLAFGCKDRRLPDAFWNLRPPLIRPLTGHLQLHLQNNEYSPAAWDDALRDVARLGGLLGRRD